MGDPKLSKVETGAKLSAQLCEIGAGLIRDHIAPGDTGRDGGGPAALRGEG